MMLLLIGGFGILTGLGLLIGLSLCRVAGDTDRWTEHYAAERQAWRGSPPVRPDDVPRHAA